MVTQRVPGSWLFPWLLALPTVLLALWVMVGWRFNGLYGQDPYAYYDFGVGPLRHFVLGGAALTPMFWPLGYPILITIASFLVGAVPPAGQIISLLGAAASVSLTYLLARDLLVEAGAEPALARRTGVIGAVVMGGTGWLVQSSAQIMPDSVALATSLLSGWALVRWCRNDSSPAWLALAAAALAWSTVTRWGQGVLALVWLLAALPAIRSRPSRFWRVLPWAALAGGVVLAVQLWLVFTVPPAPDLGPLPFAGDLGLVQGNGWALPHLSQRAFLTADGAQHYALPNLLYYATAAFRPKYLSPIFAPPALFGAVIVATRYHRALSLLVAWPAALLLFDAGLPEQNLRFVLAALPPVAILAGLGIAAAWDWVAPRWRPVLAGYLAIGLLVVVAVGLQDVDKVIAAHNADLQVARWTAETVPPGATTLSFGITLTLEHATHLRPQDLFELSVPELERLAANRRPLYLLVQVDQMEGQWALRAPGVDYRFLRRRFGLVRLGTLQGYTLFRVKSHEL